MADPNFPFYYRDFLHGTRFFTREQRGLYVELLCEQWDSNNGRISDEHIEALLANVDTSVFSPVLNKFKRDVDGYYNERQEVERIKRLKYKEKQKKNIMKRWHPDDTTVIPPYDSGNTKRIPARVIPLDNDNILSNNNDDNSKRKDNRVTTLEERKKEFARQLLLHAHEYPGDMLDSFMNYWTEPNKSKTKMRFELEKTWDLNLRLKRWANNSKDFNRTQSGTDSELKSDY